MKKYVIIVAGGTGKRMQSEIPKQFILLKGRPVLMHTLQVFHDFDPDISIIVTLPQTHIDYWKALCEKQQFSLKHQVVAGGKTRFHSVKNGLSLITESGVIAIHDGVRPLVNLKTIHDCFHEAMAKGNAIPTLPMYESMRKIKNSRSKPANRDLYRSVQTPQVFMTEIILKAYEQKYHKKFTDDASLLDAMGEILNLVEGNRENIKITTPTDLIIAEALLGTLNR